MGSTKIPSPMQKERFAKMGMKRDMFAKENPTAHLTQQLENARKVLEEKIAAKDEKGIRKAQEIIRNIEQTLSNTK